MFIEQSKLLNSYWKFFTDTLCESNSLIIFGYSGEDNHLNEQINKYANGTPIHVIEWAGSGDYYDRFCFWEKEFSNKDINLIHKKNILDFSQWDELGKL